jgi:AbiEi antitoxin C-terminal domain
MKEVNKSIFKLFREQHGVVYRRQLLRLGLTDRQIQYRLQTGEWQQAYPGIYRSSAWPVTFEQQLLAAHFAAGPESVVSHDSAAWLWGLLPHPPGRPTLTVPPRIHPQPAGVKIHRLDVDPTRVSYRRTVPCTNPLRTLIDLAATASHETVTAAVDEALSTRLVSGQAIAAELTRRAARGRRGVRPLREILTGRGVIGVPRASVLERYTAQLLDRWGIPIAGREVKAGPDDRYRLDFMLVHPVAMEVDGYTHHWSPEAAAPDHARRNQLRLGGLFLLVYTWIDVRADQRRMHQEITTALARYASDTDRRPVTR